MDLSVDGGPKQGEKDAFSNGNVLVWTLPMAVSTKWETAKVSNFTQIEKIWKLKLLPLLLHIF